MTTQDDLFFERDRLRDHEDACEKLINMIDDGVQDLDMNQGLATVTSSVLRVLADTIQQRVQEINNIIEFENNQTLSRFANRKIV